MIAMKKIDVVELYITKRIELLERENSEYKIHKKEINELKDVLDVIDKTNTSKKTQDANKIDAFVYSLSKLNEHLLNAEED